ncbi:ferrichrome-iron receptor [Algibacter lectus]|uniref:Ferrichrome-iron receptor n=1 Tax=Algibacter lectus TaxID=221126 RepID=A0A090WXV2_9FLAO|nr:ferrichrome-iron receptor [Algibacter lectus]
MNKKLLLLTVILFSVFSIYGQTGIIKGGKIISKKGKVIENASVLITKLKKGAMTNSYGDYIIEKVEPGNYILNISFVGYKSQKVAVSVKNNETTTVSAITLIESQEQLSEVVVNGNKRNKFAKKTSQFVSKMPLNQLENPQVYNSISGELLKEQVVTNLNDAIKNATGITRLWESTGRGGDGAEYYSLRGFAVQPSLLNGLPGLNNGGLDPSNIERIEVIKGPSGTLYGSSLISYGGLINVVTKQPYETFGGEISYTSGSYGLNRVTADINTPSWGG